MKRQFSVFVPGPETINYYLYDGCKCVHLIARGGVKDMYLAVFEKEEDEVPIQKE